MLQRCRCAATSGQIGQRLELGVFRRLDEDRKRAKLYRVHRDTRHAVPLCYCASMPADPVVKGHGAVAQISDLIKCGRGAEGAQHAQREEYSVRTRQCSACRLLNSATRSMSHVKPTTTSSVQEEPGRVCICTVQGGTAI